MRVLLLLILIPQKMSIFNNGTSTFYPGDIICATIPKNISLGRRQRSTQTGVPPEKMQFVPIVFKDMFTEFEDNTLVSSMVIGTAASYSKPGSMLDVTLHRQNISLIQFVDEETEEDSGVDMFDSEVTSSNPLSFAEAPRKPKTKKPRKNKKSVEETK